MSTLQPELPCSTLTVSRSKRRSAKISASSSESRVWSGERQNAFRIFTKKTFNFPAFPAERRKQTFELNIHTPRPSILLSNQRRKISISRIPRAIYNIRDRVLRRNNNITPPPLPSHAYLSPCMRRLHVWRFCGECGLFCRPRPPPPPQTPSSEDSFLRVVHQ